MKTKNKITFTTSNPDPETLAFAAKKIREAHLNELANALFRAEEAVQQGRNATIRTRGVKIEVTNGHQKAVS